MAQKQPVNISLKQAINNQAQAAQAAKQQPAAGLKSPLTQTPAAQSPNKILRDILSHFTELKTLINASNTTNKSVLDTLNTYIKTANTIAAEQSKQLSDINTNLKNSLTNKPEAKSEFNQKDFTEYIKHLFENLESKLTTINTNIEELAATDSEAQPAVSIDLSAVTQSIEEVKNTLSTKIDTLLENNKNQDIIAELKQLNSKTAIPDNAELIAILNSISDKIVPTDNAEVISKLDTLIQTIENSSKQASAENPVTLTKTELDESLKEIIQVLNKKQEESAEYTAKIDTTQLEQVFNKFIKNIQQENKQHLKELNDTKIELAEAPDTSKINQIDFSILTDIKTYLNDINVNLLNFTKTKDTATDIETLAVVNKNTISIHDVLEQIAPNTAVLNNISETTKNIDSSMKELSKANTVETPAVPASLEQTNIPEFSSDIQILLSNAEQSANNIPTVEQQVQPVENENQTETSTSEIQVNTNEEEETETPEQPLAESITTNNTVESMLSTAETEQEEQEELKNNATAQSISVIVTNQPEAPVLTNITSSNIPTQTIQPVTEEQKPVLTSITPAQQAVIIQETVTQVTPAQTETQKTENTEEGKKEQAESTTEFSELVTGISDLKQDITNSSMKPQNITIISTNETLTENISAPNTIPESKTETSVQNIPVPETEKQVQLKTITSTDYSKDLEQIKTNLLEIQNNTANLLSVNKEPKQATPVLITINSNNMSAVSLAKENAVQLTAAAPVTTSVKTNAQANTQANPQTNTQTNVPQQKQVSAVPVQKAENSGNEPTSVSTASEKPVSTAVQTAQIAATDLNNQVNPANAEQPKLVANKPVTVENPVKQETQETETVKQVPSKKAQLKENTAELIKLDKTIKENEQTISAQSTELDNMLSNFTDTQVRVLLSDGNFKDLCKSNKLDDIDKAIYMCDIEFERLNELKTKTHPNKKEIALEQQCINEVKKQLLVQQKNLTTKNTNEAKQRQLAKNIEKTNVSVKNMQTTNDLTKQDIAQLKTEQAKLKPKTQETFNVDKLVNGLQTGATLIAESMQEKIELTPEKITAQLQTSASTQSDEEQKQQAFKKFTSIHSDNKIIDEYLNSYIKKRFANIFENHANMTSEQIRMIGENTIKEFEEAWNNGQVLMPSEDGSTFSAIDKNIILKSRQQKEVPLTLEAISTTIKTVETAEAAPVEEPVTSINANTETQTSAPQQTAQTESPSFYFDKNQYEESQLAYTAKTAAYSQAVAEQPKKIEEWKSTGSDEISNLFANIKNQYLPLQVNQLTENSEISEKEKHDLYKKFALEWDKNYDAGIIIFVDENNQIVKTTKEKFLEQYYKKNKSTITEPGEPPQEKDFIVQNPTENEIQQRELTPYTEPMETAEMYDNSGELVEPPVQEFQTDEQNPENIPMPEMQEATTELNPYTPTEEPVETPAEEAESVEPAETDEETENKETPTSTEDEESEESEESDESDEEDNETLEKTVQTTDEEDLIDEDTISAELTADEEKSASAQTKSSEESQQESEQNQSDESEEQTEQTEQKQPEILHQTVIQERPMQTVRTTDRAEENEQDLEDEQQEIEPDKNTERIVASLTTTDQTVQPAAVIQDVQTTEKEQETEEQEEEQKTTPKTSEKKLTASTMSAQTEAEDADVRKAEAKLKQLQTYAQHPEKMKKSIGKAAKSDQEEEQQEEQSTPKKKTAKTQQEKQDIALDQGLDLLESGLSQIQAVYQDKSLSPAEQRKKMQQINKNMQANGQNIMKTFAGTTPNKPELKQASAAPAQTGTAAVKQYQEAKMIEKQAQLADKEKSTAAMSSVTNAVKNINTTNNTTNNTTPIDFTPLLEGMDKLCTAHEPQVVYISNGDQNAQPKINTYINV